MSSIMLIWIPREMASTFAWQGLGSCLFFVFVFVFGFAKIHLALPLISILSHVP